MFQGRVVKHHPVERPLRCGIAWLLLCKQRGVVLISLVGMSQSRRVQQHLPIRDNRVPRGVVVFHRVEIPKGELSEVVHRY